MKYIKKFDIIADVDPLSPKLYHAKTAAALIPRDFPEYNTTEIVNAVKWHTTGYYGMTLLESVVYLADYISDDRNYNGVEDMRRLCKSDSDEAILYALTFGIPDLVSKGRVIHPDSIDLYNEVIIKKQGGNGI